MKSTREEELKKALKEVHTNIKNRFVCGCDECSIIKAELKGIQEGRAEARKEELEFLKKHLEYVKKARKDVPGLQPFQYPIQERINFLEEEKK